MPEQDDFLVTRKLCFPTGMQTSVEFKIAWKKLRWWNGS